MKKDHPNGKQVLGGGNYFQGKLICIVIQLLTVILFRKWRWYFKID